MQLTLIIFAHLLVPILKNKYRCLEFGRFLRPTICKDPFHYFRECLLGEDVRVQQNVRAAERERLEAGSRAVVSREI